MLGRKIYIPHNLSGTSKEYLEQSTECVYMVFKSLHKEGIKDITSGMVRRRGRKDYYELAPKSKRGWCVFDYTDRVMRHLFRLVKDDVLTVKTNKNGWNIFNLKNNKKVLR